MSILDTLVCGNLPAKENGVNKVTQRRVSFRKNLKKRFEGTESKKGAGWFEKEGDKYRAVFRYKNSVIEFPNGKNCFYTDTEEEMKQIYKDAYEEVGEGMFDDILEAHLKRLASKLASKRNETEE